MQGILAADGNVLLWIQQNLRNEVLTPFMKVVTKLGDHGIFWVILTLILLLIPRTRKAGLCSLFALVSVYVINNLIIKNIVARTRPYEVVEGLILIGKKADDFSFPSGHTASSFASMTALIRSGAIPKPCGICLIILAVLIALSRLYVGIHYPTDVIFGMISGIACGFLGVFLYREFFKK